MAKNRVLFNALMITLLVINVEGLGVNWGTVTTHQLPHKTVVQMLKDNGINKVKLFDSDASILASLAGSGLEVMIGMGNTVLQEMGEYKNAEAWVKQNVTAYNPTSKSGVNITMVGVGNEPFLKDFKDMFVNYTLPAVQNIQKALDEAGLSHIKATIPFNGDVYYSPSWNPVPSAGQFRPDIKDALKPIIEHLAKHNAPFMVNIYPFLSLYYGKGAFPLDFAFFDGVAKPLQDNDVQYGNCFDANLDTLVAALKAEGFGNMSIIVGEIGWPTDGDVNANTTLAARFYKGLVEKLASGKGTPLRPEYTEVYFFGLMDEDAKSTLPGNFERHWGVFGYDGQPRFPLDLSGGKNKTLVGAKDVKYLPSQWCVLKSDANNKTQIESAVKYACDRADCTALEYGSSCSGLDTNGQASYAINAFFQGTDQAKEACNFEGLATLTTEDPSTKTCKFTINLASEKASTPASSPALSPTSSTSSPGSSSHSKSPATALQVVMGYLVVLVSLSFWVV